tara:strand:+ start:2398 stop:2598 length:201 start_codon:yes stop_codon:yes gene_type:complete
VKLFFNLNHQHLQGWVKAKKLLTQLVDENSILNFYYNINIMLDRVADLEKNDPGEDWDQVYRATSK